MSDSLDVDVAIIGAGPAGSTLGALLAGSGRSVVILDRDVLPRDKVCGEFLSWDAFPILDLIGATGEILAAGAPAIHRCVIVGRRARLEFDLPAPARGISRMVLDEILVQRATSAGAIRRDGWTATELKGEPGTWRISISRDDDQAVIHARVVVGAWGRWGRLDLRLGRSFARDRARRHFGFKRHYRPMPSGPEGDAIRLFSFESGYLGVSSIEGGLVNICGLAHASRISGLKGGWDAFAECLASEEPRLRELFGAHAAAQESFLSSDPVIFRARKPASQGVLMVGDAAGLIDPLTGNGMAMAIQSALVAAPHVLERLGGTSQPDAAYSRAYGRFFGSRLRWSRRIAFLLSRPSLLDASLSAARSPGIGRYLVQRTRADSAKLAREIDRWTSSVRNL